MFPFPYYDMLWQRHIIISKWKNPDLYFLSALALKNNFEFWQITPMLLKKSVDTCLITLCSPLSHFVYPHAEKYSN